MILEFRIKDVLAENGLLGHGIEQRIAKETKLHRHTVGKLFRNQMKNPSLEVMGKICQWLIDNNVPAEKLPGALFGCRAPDLWQAVGNSKSVRIYMGMYHHTVGSKSKEGRWGKPESLARGDASVQARFITQLSSEGEMGNLRPPVNTRYIPFKFSTETKDVEGPWFNKDKKRAKEIYGEMLKRAHYESAILLGSQRVNYVLECLVAGLFRCDPFERPKGKPKIPFYLCYRGFDRQVPSCFGGIEKPPGHPEEPISGIYYLEKEGKKEKWNLIDCNHDKNQDAGIAIVIRAGDTVKIALFGVSGRATAAVGKGLVEHAEEFWPAPGEALESKGREIGIYVCRVGFPDAKDESAHEIEDWEKDKLEVIPLGDQVLKRCLR
jgi:hypothetical protein